MLLTHESCLEQIHGILILISAPTGLVTTTKENSQSSHASTQPQPFASRGGGRFGRGRNRGGRWNNRGRGRGRWNSGSRGGVPGSVPFQQNSSYPRGILGPPPSPISTPSFPTPNPAYVDIECQISKIYGHSAIDCPQRLNHAYVTSDLSKNFAAFSLHDNSDRAWYMDGGASSHMTYDQGQLFDISPYSFSHELKSQSDA
ncbi:hypothetical protein Salat_2771200 [Sesamum alatum]|uniref:Uncharacterized protein n=1 Tax=Sesamum alatum TaxID=300844 RepID=A0AAE2C9D6_9LAMI|nr:hypothetical protein Salat_2771200 [Sesamum alatum]